MRRDSRPSSPTGPSSRPRLHSTDYINDLEPWHPSNTSQHDPPLSPRHFHFSRGSPEPRAPYSSYSDVSTRYPESSQRNYPGNGQVHARERSLNASYEQNYSDIHYPNLAAQRPEYFYGHSSRRPPAPSVSVHTRSEPFTTTLGRPVFYDEDDSRPRQRAHFNEATEASAGPSSASAYTGQSVDHLDPGDFGANFHSAPTFHPHEMAHSPSEPPYQSPDWTDYTAHRRDGVSQEQTSLSIPLCNYPEWSQSSSGSSSFPQQPRVFEPVDHLNPSGSANSERTYSPYGSGWQSTYNNPPPSLSTANSHRPRVKKIKMHECGICHKTFPRYVLPS